MEKPDHTHLCFCPLHGIFDTISKKWALLVIAAIGNSGSTGFNELKHILGDVSSKTLSSTLKELGNHHLVERKVNPGTPPTVSYSLTVSGWELRELLIPILEWAIKNGETEDEDCPIRLSEKNSLKNHSQH